MRRAAGGGNVGAHAVGEGEQTNLVAADQGDVGEQEHRVEGMVKRREPHAGVARHQSPAIDQEDDALTLVELKCPAGQLSPSRRRPPVDVTGVVAFDVVSHPLELVI